MKYKRKVKVVSNKNKIMVKINKSPRLLVYHNKNKNYMIKIKLGAEKCYQEGNWRV